MEIRHHGIAVSPGVAIGPAFVIHTEGVRITHQTVTAEHVPGEISRLHRALEEAATEARENRQRITSLHGPAIGNIFAAQGSILEDPGFRNQTETLIRTQCYSAEYAVSRVMREFVKRLEESALKSVAEQHKAEVRRRAKDFIDIERQILLLLQGENSEPLGELTTPVIILAADLMPSETADFSPRTVHAFATESGGATSHTAILAGALEIPAVVGLSRFLADVSGGDTVIVDGEEGILIIDPDEATIARYEEKRAAERSRADRYDSLRDKTSTTSDGTPIRLLGNIELSQEAAHCLERGAEGVGLYRTEFLYLNKTSDPTEEEHFEAYRSVVQTLGPTRPVVIRTLDLGADKFSSLTDTLGIEKNPFLGLRSVRLCLRKLDLFKTQLRAILRVATLGNVRVMFPMISTVDELRQCKALLNEVKEDLEDEGIPFKRDLSVGTMIEVPSAALVADILAREVDFFSIGTNDLIQYTLAADRNNENVAHLYNPVDPAVLRLIKRVVEAADKEQIEVNVCGEMSGEPLYAPLLVGLGLRQLSVTPRKVPEIKRVIRQLRVDEAKRLADHALNMDTARHVGSYLRDQLRRIRPEAAD